MKSDDRWKQEAIERDMMATMKKLGKGKNIIIKRTVPFTANTQFYYLYK